jgi:hypothetical protein
MSLFRKAAGRRTTSSVPPRTRPALEELEVRINPYSVTGNAWPTPTVLTISFVPDGVLMSAGSNGNVYSDLFTKFNAKWSTAQWQDAILSAAQQWAQAANINFTVVSDNGTSPGGGSYQQGDPGMGDIRIGGYAMNTSYLGLGYQPPPANNYSIAGDLDLNTAAAINMGSTYDLQTIAMHEIGHALGLDHSTTSSAVMYKSYHGTLKGLTTDDVNGIRAIYGARQADVYDSVASNDTFLTATPLTTLLDPTALTGQATGLDITTTSDVDYYTVVAPTNSTSLTISVQSTGLSLLRPSLTVYGSDQSTVLGSATSSSYTGDTLTVNVANVTAGQVLYFKVAGADTTAFGTGAYALTMSLGGNALPTVTLPNTQLLNGSVLQGGGGQALEVSESPDFYSIDDSVANSSDTNPTDGVTTVSDALSGVTPVTQPATQPTTNTTPTTPTTPTTSAATDGSQDPGTDLTAATPQGSDDPGGDGSATTTPATGPTQGAHHGTAHGRNGHHRTHARTGGRHAGGGTAKTHAHRPHGNHGGKG